MTAQTHDSLSLDGCDYDVTRRSAKPLFDPTAHGLMPVSTSSGCGRGHQCHFVVDQGMISLQTLWINHGINLKVPPFSREMLPLPKFNGITATERGLELPYDFQGRYDEIDLRLAYSGSLLVSRTMLSDEPRCHGFAWPWHYDCTLVLTFKDGQLMEQSDVSEAMRTFEQRYCFDGLLYGDNRPNGLRYLRRHIGRGFKF